MHVLGVLAVYLIHFRIKWTGFIEFTQVDSALEFGLFWFYIADVQRLVGWTLARGLISTELSGNASISNDSNIDLYGLFCMRLQCYVLFCVSVSREKKVIPLLLESFFMSSKLCAKLRNNNVLYRPCTVE